MLNIRPLDIVTYNPGGRPSDTIFDMDLVMFAGYCDKEMQLAYTFPVVSVDSIPKNREPGFFYCGSDIIRKTLDYANALITRAYAIRMNRENYDPKKMPPLEYVPSTRYLEINVNIYRRVPVEYLGTKVLDVPKVVGAEILKYVEEMVEKREFTPAERILLLLTDAELKVVDLKLWSKRKKAVLLRLWGKFEPNDIAAFFKVNPEEILKVAKKLHLQ